MLIRHSFLYVVAKFLPGVLGFVATALLTRILDPSQYGKFGLILAIMAMVSSLAFNWLGTVVIRFYGANRSDDRMPGTFVQMFLILLVLSAVAAALIWELGGARSATYALILGLGTVLAWSSSWFEFVSQFEIAKIRPVRYLWMNLGRAVFTLVGSVGLAWLTDDPLWTAVGMAVGLLVGAGLGSFRPGPLGRRNFNPVLARRALAFGIPLAISMTLAALITAGMRILLERLDSAAALGLYTAAFLLIQNSLMILGSGIASAGYRLAVHAVDSGDPAVERRQILENGTLLLAVLAPASLGVALTAEGMAAIFVGAEFRPTVAELTPWIAAATFLASFRAYYLDYAFQLGRRASLQVWVTAAAAVVALGLGFYLIPQAGPLGAAQAVTAAMAVSCVLAALVGRLAHPIPLPFGAATRVALATLFMGATVLAVPGSGLTRFAAQVAVGILAYAATAVVLDLFGLRSKAAALVSLRT